MVDWKWGFPTRRRRDLKDRVAGAAADLTHVLLGFSDGTMELWTKHGLKDKKVCSFGGLF